LNHSITTLNGNITKVHLNAFGINGVGAAGVKLNYLIVMTSGSVDHAYVAPATVQTLVVQPCPTPAPDNSLQQADDTTTDTTD
jgi:hypothetical protein